MKADVERAYGELTKAVSEALLPGGYRRSGNTFRARNGDNWKLINLQRSTKSTKASVLFTANLGVFLARLAEFDAATFGRAPKVPLASDCHLRVRLGELDDPATERWWILDRETQLTEVTLQVTQRLETEAVPLLDKYSADEHLRDLWLSGRSPGLTKVQRLRYLAVCCQP